MFFFITTSEPLSAGRDEAGDHRSDSAQPASDRRTKSGRVKAAAQNFVT
jgi:hypothetical protein